MVFLHALPPFFRLRKNGAAKLFCVDDAFFDELPGGDVTRRRQPRRQATTS
jgi:hypothetical protein